MRGEKPIVKEVRNSWNLADHKILLKPQNASFPDWAVYLQSSDGKGQREYEQWRIQPKVWGGWKDAHLQTQVRLVQEGGKEIILV